MSSSWDRTEESPVDIVTTSGRWYTVCTNSSCFLVCNSNVVPYYEGVFRYSGRVPHIREVENHSFIEFEFPVKNVSVYPQLSDTCTLTERVVGASTSQILEYVETISDPNIQC